MFAVGFVLFCLGWLWEGIAERAFGIKDTGIGSSSIVIGVGLMFASLSVILWQHMP